MLIDKDAIGFKKLIRDFFLALYNQVLDGNPFNELFSTTLRDHFDNFSKLNGVGFPEVRLFESREYL